MLRNNLWVIYLKTLCYKAAKTIYPAKFESKYNRNRAKLPSGMKETEKNYFFHAHYEDNVDFSTYKTDVKLLAYYLPQFHTFPENDAWWGKGFTEWTNTRAAKPRFSGHYQPREPHADIGYYDLSDVQIMAQQAKLAKEHGIYGFCMYYYWFSGKKLMEKPLDNLMKHPEIDFPFCLCWANENWTRRWDGKETDILIQQNYTEADPLHFIQDIAGYIQDKRYIRHQGKPIILVYNIPAITKPAHVFNTWRTYCRETLHQEIEIWGVRTNISLSQFFGNIVDREVEFPPHGVTSELFTSTAYLPAQDRVYNYASLVENILSADFSYYKNPSAPIIHGVMIGWDNTARHPIKEASIWSKFSLYTYYQWLRFLVQKTLQNDPPQDRYIMLNAWNEWAEGTYLEPDKKYGYAALNVTSRALFNLPFEGPFAPNAVLIVCLESLGDIIACEPVIAAAQAKYPGRPIYWVTTFKYAELLEAHPHLSGVIPIYEMAQWQALKQSLPATVDVIDLHFAKRHYYLAPGQIICNNNRADITEENYFNCAKSILDIFSQVAGLPSNNAAPAFYLSKRVVFPTDLPPQYIVVHTQSVVDTKHWPCAKWEALVNVLQKQGHKIVEVGSVPSFDTKLGVMNKTGLPSLQDTAWIISKASLFIGIDSAWAHAANALNIPAVILLGKYRNFDAYMPYSGNYQNGKNAIIVRAPQGKPAADISVQTVLNAITELRNTCVHC